MRFYAGQLTQIIMKSSTSSLLFATSIALGSALTSCVVPVDGYAGSSTTITSYSPGYRTTSLPSGYRSEIISGSNYYYNNGAYYRQDSGGYVVVDAPRTSRYYTEYNNHHHSSGTRDTRYDGGQVIYNLPRGYREISYSGQPYYQYGSQYYRRQGSGYIQVSSPY